MSLTLLQSNRFRMNDPRFAVEPHGWNFCSVPGTDTDLLSHSMVNGVVTVTVWRFLSTKLTLTRRSGHMLITADHTAGKAWGEDKEGVDGHGRADFGADHLTSVWMMTAVFVKSGCLPFRVLFTAVLGREASRVAGTEKVYDYNTVCLFVSCVILFTSCLWLLLSLSW